MQLERLTYAESQDGWSSPLPSELDSKGTLVVVFGDPDLDALQDALGQLAESFPESCIIGCSTAGEIAQDQIHEESLSVAVTKFDKTELACTSVAIERAEDSEDVGQRVAEQLDRDDLAAIFMLSQGLNVNGSGLVQGVNARLDRSDVVVTGGLAGDGARFEQTWVLDSDGAARNDIVAAVGFYGDAIRVSHGSMGGWDHFGLERKVTRAEDNVLFELDNEPALALYKRYLGEQADDLPAAGLLFPLEIQRSGTDRALVRTILGVDEEDQSLTLAGDIPEGSTTRLMKATFDRLVDGAEGAAQQAVEMQGHEGPTLALGVSCVGRRLVLRERTEDELEIVLDRLPEDTQLVGFYSYGELSPPSQGEPCDLHNQTMTLSVFSEA